MVRRSSSRYSFFPLFLFFPRRIGLAVCNGTTSTSPYVSPTPISSSAVSSLGMNLSAATKRISVCASPVNTITRWIIPVTVSYTHLRAHETPEHLVCRLLLEKKKKKN
eukprot:TRINITY_DN18686_c0_g2_i5.p2 TRINITY_DN18686_c0_g2~~TRINITY_DN18686_c0_g2_i5.p2  ORF type:complete len:108 (-),score=33.13 TRINITY_DN18686_c0_g2_i5:55-378(-)